MRFIFLLRSKQEDIKRENLKKVIKKLMKCKTYPIIFLGNNKTCFGDIGHRSQLKKLIKKSKNAKVIEKVVDINNKSE